MTNSTKAVLFEKKGDIGLLSINYPPVNAIGFPVRKGLVDGIAMALEDKEIKAVLIICQGRTFCAGADIREFSLPTEQAPTMEEVLNSIESCKIPVITAIHGTAFGAGLETALTCSYRVALVSARFGLPEVKLGLIPGAGGTQRLPRLVGAQKALEMICSGNPIGADEALSLGLIDKIIQGDLLKGAMEFTKTVISENMGLRIVSQMSEKIQADQNNSELFDNYRKIMAKRARGFEAPQACIQAVEAAVSQPFAQGLKTEEKLFEKLVTGAQSAAQQYYFFAERQVGKIPDIPKDTPQLEIKKTGVIGAGTMGGGITMNFVNAGIPVILVETKKEFLDRGLRLIRKNYEISAYKGKISLSDVEKRMSLITGTLAIEDLADADMVIEAVFENMDLKKTIFGKLDKICKPDAIMATNTSYLDVNEIAAHTSRPEFVLGLHFFSPANVMRLLEIVRGDKTSKTVLATCLSLAKKIRKIAVLVGVCHGFAGNRMFEQRLVQAELLLQEGALPVQVDKEIYDFGFPMGHFSLLDLVGNDIGWDKETSNGSNINEVICEQGRFGLKTGAGYYQYESGSRIPVPSVEIDKMIEEFSKKRGIIRRDISKEEIVQRCIYSIINEGAKILDEGIAVRPSDLDVIWVNGYGWPVYLGGPMFYADMIGLEKILNTLKNFQNRFGDDFKPAALLEKLVKEGKGFKDLK